MSRYLITGGAGFVGSNLADKLASDLDNQVVVVDNLSTGLAQNITRRSNLKFIKADVNNFSEISGLFYSGDFDYVFHYAAVVGVQRTLLNPMEVLRDIEGFRNILDLSKTMGVKRVFFSSSSEVYGEPVELPQHEERTPLNSRLPYAVVKNVGETFLRSYRYEHGLNFTIFRFFNTYGPRQSPDFVMSKFIDAALAGQAITIFGDGLQTRTFCYIKDNIDATIRTLSDDAAIDSVINIGSESEITIQELAETIIRVTGSESNILHLPALKEGDMTRRQPDATKMKSLLDRPLTSLEAGIKLVVDSKTAEVPLEASSPSLLPEIRLQGLYG